MKMIKAIVKQKIGIDPTVCSYCESPNLVTEILVSLPILANNIFTKNGDLMPNRAPSILPLHGLEKWMEVRA